MQITKLHTYAEVFSWYEVWSQDGIIASTGELGAIAQKSSIPKQPAVTPGYPESTSNMSMSICHPIN